MTRRAPTPAKITRPRPRRVLERPRLVRVLDQARQCPLVWITAPPGAGKTTLVSAYLERRRLAHVWYQVDGGDADFAALFHYLGLAAGKAATRGRKPLPRLAPEYRPNLNAFFRVFFRALFGRWRAPHVVVFDNYQEIPANAVFHDAVREALGQVPEGSNVVVLSRDDPPPAFAHAQVNGLMARVDWDELKLTAEEANRLIDLRKKGAPTPELRKQLYALCEGWIAGLLLLLETQAAQIAERAPRKFAPQVLFDYFGSQIFDRMEAAARDVLVQSAFLPRMSVQSVERLTGSPNAGGVIEDLHRRNYFVVRRGDELPAYEYHQLFRNFLLNRAPAMYAPERLRRIMGRAGSLLAESGQLEDAVGLSREIGDDAAIVEIIVRHAGALVQQRRTGTVLAWIRALPEERVQSAPWVLYWLGVCGLDSDPTKSRQPLERALRLFDAEPNAAGAYLSWSVLVNTYLYIWDDFRALNHWIAVFDEMRSRHGDFASAEIETQVAGAVFGALIFQQPGHPRLAYWEERLHALLANATDPALAVPMALHLLTYYVWSGHFPKAGMVVQAGEALVRKPGTPAVVLLHWGAMSPCYYWSIGDYETATRIVRDTLESAAKLEVGAVATLVLQQHVHIELARGDFEAAAAVLEQARETLMPEIPDVLGHHHFLAAMTALFRGDLATARECIEGTLRATQKSGATFPQLAAHFGAAQVAFAEGDHERAAWHVASGCTFMSNVTVDYFCALFDTRTAFARGEEEAGLRRLADALALGRQHGIVHYPWWSPAMMADFYARALDAGIETEYVQAAIRKRKLVPEKPPVDVEAWPWPVKVYTLGRFSVLIDGQPLQFSGKAQRKPLELLMALVAFGGRDVAESQLTEALWPDAEGGAAHEACAIALHRLRKLLGCDRAVGLAVNRFSLDSRYVWVDVWAFERGVGQAGAQRALALYQGPFLGGQVDFAWALPLRERLRTKFLRHVLERGRSLIDARDFEAAIAMLEKGLNVDPLAEELYRGLMRCYQELERRAEALGVYERCRKTLAAALGVAPAPETVALYQKLQN